MRSVQHPLTANYCTGVQLEESFFADLRSRHQVDSHTATSRILVQLLLHIHSNLGGERGEGRGVGEGGRGGLLGMVVMMSNSGKGGRCLRHRGRGCGC